MWTLFMPSLALSLPTSTSSVCLPLHCDYCDRDRDQKRFSCFLRQELKLPYILFNSSLLCVYKRTRQSAEDQKASRRVWEGEPPGPDPQSRSTARKWKPEKSGRGRQSQWMHRGSPSLESIFLGGVCVPCVDTLEGFILLCLSRSHSLSGKTGGQKNGGKGGRGQNRAERKPALYSEFVWCKQSTCILTQYWRLWLTAVRVMNSSQNISRGRNPYKKITQVFGLGICTLFCLYYIIKDGCLDGEDMDITHRELFVQPPPHIATWPDILISLIQFGLLLFLLLTYWGDMSESSKGSIIRIHTIFWGGQMGLITSVYLASQAVEKIPKTHFFSYFWIEPTQMFGFRLYVTHKEG